MICCKITADFNNSNGSFVDALKKLGRYADLYWEDNYLFLAETETNFLNEKKIIRILKTCGYTKFFINIYSKDNQPNDSISATCWVANKLIKINYISYEQENQKMLQNTITGLEALEGYVDVELKKQKEKEVENSGTRRKGNSGKKES